MKNIIKYPLLFVMVIFIFALPVVAIPFSYTVVSNEEIDWNHFRTVVTMPGQPPVIAVRGAIDAGKSNNIVVDTVTKDGLNYIIEGHLISYINRKNFLFNPWWNTTWKYRIDNSIPDGVRPYQLQLNISNSFGTNNATWVFCNGHCNSGFTDIRFTLDNTTLLPYWIENSVTGSVLVNLTANGTVSMYYGNSLATSDSALNDVFGFYDGFNDGDYNIDPTWSVVAGSWSASGFVLEKTTKDSTIVVPISVPSSYYNFDLDFYSKHYSTNLLGAHQISLSSPSGDYIISHGTDGSLKVGKGSHHGSITSTLISSTWTKDTNWHNIRLVRSSSGYLELFFDGISKGTSSDTSISGIDEIFIYLGAQTTGYDHVPAYLDSFFFQNYASPELSWSVWSEESNYLVSSWGNNYTNDQDLYFSLDSNRYVNFNITRWYSGDTIDWYIDSVSQSHNYDNLSVNINTVTSKNITAVVTNTSYSNHVSWFVTLDMELLTPVNGSIVYSPYPPVYSDTDFTWSSVGFLYYHFLVSTDSNFSHIVSDKYVSSNLTNLTLLNGYQYFWKVQSYIDSNTPGSWSSVFSFNLTANYSTPSGTGVHGVVYEFNENGDLSIITDATVYIYKQDNSWQDSQIVGSNGYYSFSNLTNSMAYTLYAQKTEYDTTSALSFTTGVGVYTRKDIFMKKTLNPYIPTWIYSTFKLSYSNGTSLSNATVEVFKYGSIYSEFTGVSGTDGDITFLLDKVQRYSVKISDINGTLLYTWVGTPREEILIVLDVPVTSILPGVPPSSRSWFSNMTGNGSWGISDLTSSNLESYYGIGAKGQGIIMSILTIFFITWGGLAATLVVFFGFGLLGVLSIKFVMIFCVFSVAWHIVKGGF